MSFENTLTCKNTLKVSELNPCYLRSSYLLNADLSSPVECSHYYHHSLHQWAHKAITLSAQPPLSLAANLATFQLFHPALPLSLSTVLLQVVFGLPLALRPSGMYPNIFPLRSKGAPTVNKKLLSAYSYLTETEKKSLSKRKNKIS